MLDNSVTHPGTLLFKGGKIYIDGWRLKEPGMCREHVIFACLYVARQQMEAASKTIAKPGGGENTCADMPSDTPRDWLCKESREFLKMFDKPGDDPMRPTMFGGAPAVVVEAVADALVRKTDADIMGAAHSTGDICERLGRLECDVLRIHGVDISDQVEDLVRFYRNESDTECTCLDDEDAGGNRFRDWDEDCPVHGTKREAREAACVLRTALTKIRTAGYNWDSTAQWMQKVAANALEPEKWPDAGEQPSTVSNEQTYLDALVKIIALHDRRDLLDARTIAEEAIARGRAQ